MTELKPCPFCGGVANVIDHHNDDGSVSVGCNNDTCLGFSGLGWLYSTEAEAAEAWNTRAATTIGYKADALNVTVADPKPKVETVREVRIDYSETINGLGKSVSVETFMTFKELRKMVRGLMEVD